MKNPFHPGDKKTYATQVSEDKLAVFDAGMVHPVYGTFALGRDAEWTCRLFVLEMKEGPEEGIGSYLSIEHLYPAPLGSVVHFTATLESVKGNEVYCTWEAFANGETIARGRTGQRIIDKEKFDRLLSRISANINSAPNP